MNILAGDYKVTADLPRTYERVWGQGGGTVRVGCYGDVNIGVSRVPLQGTLVKGDGKPESMPVTIHAFAIDRSQRTASKERSTFTYARDGTWSFDGLPAGEYVIGVGVHFKSRWDPVRMPFWYPAGTRPEDAEIVRIAESGVVGLELRHPPAPREIQFSGVIVDQDGRPTTNTGGVLLHDLDLDQGVANGSADVLGRFQVRGWERRRYTITAYDCRGRVPGMSEPVPIDPKSTETLRIVLTRPCPARSP
jgi:hypothetical protein